MMDDLSQQLQLFRLEEGGLQLEGLSRRDRAVQALGVELVSGLPGIQSLWSEMCQRVRDRWIGDRWERDRLLLDLYGVLE